ncbi:hypothetical protein K7X08_028865 [Anisodus acutangulus]|uniref:Uncharacterized protein n=1 Tax=Anisodus acutangulus TaxID=402998 RepID=A0A9Q1L366_9SOLA|nr:hypothetical protein K7X08_028865 [Anisodus acutangulus]
MKIHLGEGDRVGNHLEDKSKNSKIDDLSGPTEVVDEGMKEGDQVVDDAVDGCVKVGDDVVDDAVDGGKISGDEELGIGKSSRDELQDYVGDHVAEEERNVMEEVDWSVVPDTEFSKFT